jgi:UDP-N-acetylglucosamine acyltransferase
MFEGEGAFADRLDAAADEYADLPEIMRIIAFIREDSKRPLCLPER